MKKFKKKRKRGKIILILLVAFILTCLGITWGSLRWLKVYNHVLHFDGLPAHLDGFRILQISDLHSNSPRRINFDIWRHIDNLNFDIAVITGDIILDPRHTNYGPIEVLEPHRQALIDLANRVPTFFVEGNHESDYFMQFSQFMAEVGIRFLFNERIYLETNGGVLGLIGTADASTLNRHQYLNADFDALFENLTDNFYVVLTHQPQLFDRFKTSGISLAITGHTHGGQIRLPFLPTIYAPGQGFWPRYGNGFYNYGNAVLYVSRGIGTTYFPTRFWNRPEIAVFELRN